MKTVYGVYTLKPRSQVSQVSGKETEKMNRKTKLATIIAGISIIALVGGWGWINLQARSSEPAESHAEEISVVQHFSYIGLTDKETINQADAIFLGKIANISPTRWNQDSGELWDDGLLIHEIEFEVIQPIVDTVGLDNRATITMLGNSPLDENAGHDLDFKVGEQAVVFVRETDLAWREGGSRRILEFIGDPIDAYYRQRGNGLYQGRPGKAPVSLEELTARIEQERSTLQQP